MEATARHDYPFLVGLGGWVLFKDRVEPGVAVGAVIAFLGLGLLGVDSGGSPSGLLGNALALAAAFFYAGSLLGTARLCRRHDSTLVTAWSTLGAALTSLPFALIEGGFLPSDWQGWVYVLAYGVVTLGSYLLVARTEACPGGAGRDPRLRHAADRKPALAS
jgi:drug/metabolite transporter (DMT)-like permease